MRILKKGLIWGLIVSGVFAAAAYSNPIEGGSSVTVTNSWDITGDLRVGELSNSNSLSIINGGSVSDDVAYIGAGSTGFSSDANTVLVSGSGSSWNNGSDLYIGNGGSSNSLLIEAGGLVYDTNAVIGVEESSDHNFVVVSGTNSVWENFSTLTVGSEGDTNSLTISDGATVNSQFGKIGSGNMAFGNTVEVSGAGSTWNNTGDLDIGNYYNQGGGNSLTITNGGQVVVGVEGDLVLYDDLNLNEGGWLKIDGYSDLTFGDNFHYNSGSTLEVTGRVNFDGVVSDRNTLIFQGDNATWLGSSVSSLKIGVTGDNNTVIISNKANITTHTTYIGKEISSTGNVVLVTGADSAFTVQTNLYVGYEGWDNELRVIDGATASALTGYVGYAASSDNNRIVVEGEGSTFQNSGLIFIGYDGGESNRLQVLNGGLATLGTVYIGFTNAMYSSVLVDGSNSTFAANALHIGEASQFNSFTVVNGAQVSSGTSTIGTGTNGNGNLAIVTGTGSLWAAGSLTIGDAAATNFNNSLTIENGGKVLASELVISTNGAGNALNLNSGGWLTVASDMDTRRDGFNWASWSTLEVQGSITMAGTTNIIGSTTNRYGYHDGQNTLILSGSGIWSNDYTVTVGQNASSNVLKLLDGGMIDHFGAGTVGSNSSSTFNLVEINGSGSEWENGSDFTVGVYGSDNTVVVTNQGTLDVAGAVIGLEAGADRNQILVTGSGTLFDTTRLEVGVIGSSNKLSVLQGGHVSNHDLYIGRQSNGNHVLVDGAGSRLDSASDTIIGELGSSNALTILNGGVVTAANTYLGEYVGANANTLTVDGSFSILDGEYDTHVGHKGSDNSMFILNGAQVFDRIGMLGTDSGANSNHAVIDGIGSLWYHEDEFIAGNSGSSNTVTIRNGATLIDDAGYIGYHATAMGNRVIVDNATWGGNSGGLSIGLNGSGNSLVITNGAEVFSGESRIGKTGYANDNLVLVTGDGSVWNISKSLWVGNNLGSNNTLVVENGGQVVVGEDFGAGLGNWVNVNTGGTVTVYGDTIFTAGFNIGDGGTFETFGGVSGLGGVLESGRTLRLAGAGASWDEPGDILLESGAELYIGAGASASTPSNYIQQTSATLHFGFATNSSGGPLAGSLSVGQYADFADGANFFYSSDIGNLSFDATYTNTLVAADTLVVGGQTNATTADLQQYLIAGGSLLSSISLFVHDQDILAIINRISANDALDPANADLRAVIAEIEARALAGDPLANKQMGIINSMSDSQALSELTQFYTLGTPNYQHMDGVLMGLNQIEKRTSEMLMDTLFFTPDGAYGPAIATGEWRGWVSAYGNNGTRDSGGGYSGFDVGTYGTVLGVDKSFNNMVVGLSGGLAGSSIKQEDGDSSDASTAYGALYASFRIKQVDWDLVGSYGGSSIESSSGTIFGSTAETDASTAVFYIAASEEQRYGQYTVTPMAAFQAALYSQDGYDEVSANAIGRSVEDYDRWSYRSILGATLSTAKPFRSFDLLMRFKANWEHEFNTDIDTLNYSLIGGTDPHYFTIQAPVEDAIDLGVGLGLLFNEDLEFSVGLDGRFSQDYLGVSYNGRIQYTF